MNNLKYLVFFFVLLALSFYCEAAAEPDPKNGWRNVSECLSFRSIDFKVETMVVIYTQALFLASNNR